MRSILLCCCFLMIFFAEANAQIDKPNIVKLNPLGYFILSGGVSFERILQKKISLQLNFGGGKAFEEEFTLKTARLDGRWYFSKTKLAAGFYGAVGAGYEDFSFITGVLTYQRKYRASGFAAANYYGYQHTFKSGITLDAFGGLQKLFSKFRDKDGYEYLPNTPKAWVLYVAPVAGVSVGYRF